MKREYIQEVFENWNQLKLDGIYLSGINREGEFKKWHPNNKLWIHSNYKDGELDGVGKRWRDDGKLVVHKLFKNGDMIKDYLE